MLPRNLWTATPALTVNTSTTPTVIGRVPAEQLIGASVIFLQHRSNRTVVLLEDKFSRNLYLLSLRIHYVIPERKLLGDVYVLFYAEDPKTYPVSIPKCKVSPLSLKPLRATTLRTIKQGPHSLPACPESFPWCRLAPLCLNPLRTINQRPPRWYNRISDPCLHSSSVGRKLVNTEAVEVH